MPSLEIINQETLQELFLNGDVTLASVDGCAVFSTPDHCVVYCGGWVGATWDSLEHILADDDKGEVEAAARAIIAQLSIDLEVMHEASSAETLIIGD